DRSTGTPGATGAAAWFVAQLQPYGFVVRPNVFEATIPGRGRMTFRNLVAVVPGRSPAAIVVVAHRDNSGVGTGANDNPSGTEARAGSGAPRLECAGDRPRLPSASMPATAATRVVEQGGDVARRPSALRQLLDLAFPFSFYEQAPFLARGISAVTLTSAGDRPP